MGGAEQILIKIREKNKANQKHTNLPVELLDPSIGGFSDPSIGGLSDPSIGGLSDPPIGGLSDPSIGGLSSSVHSTSIFPLAKQNFPLGRSSLT